MGAVNGKCCDEMFGLNGIDESIIYAMPVGTISEKDKQKEEDFYAFVKEEGLEGEKPSNNEKMIHEDSLKIVSGGKDPTSQIEEADLNIMYQYIDEQWDATAAFPI